MHNLHHGFYPWTALGIYISRQSIWDRPMTYVGFVV